MRVWLVAVIVLHAGLVRADDDAVAAARALADRQVKAIEAGDAKAFAAPFGADGYVVLPTAAGEGRGKPAIEAAAKAWLGGLGKVSAKADAPRCGDLYMGKGAWCSLTISATIGRAKATWRVLYAAEHRAGATTILAEHIGEAVDDRAALAAAAAGRLPKLADIYVPDSAEKYVDVALDPQRIAAQQPADSPATVLIGTAPGELWTGNAAVAARLKAWRSLPLASTHFTFGGSSGDDDVFVVWVVAHLDATLTAGGKRVKVPYRALAIYALGPAAAEAGEVLVGAEFSVATR